VEGRPVLEPYAADRIRDSAHGAPLIPWPNRLEDGRYPFDGATYQVPLTEPEKRNAIHGFLLWQPWEAAEPDADRVVMTTHSPCTRRSPVPPPLLDRVLRGVSRAANYSKLWLASSALLAVAGGPRDRHAGVDGLASVALTSAVVNGALKPLSTAEASASAMVSGSAGAAASSPDR
jgi:Aldose 1-epimerase